MKHGIDFIRAQALWEDPNYIEIPAKCEDEQRFAVIGRIGNKIWAGFITHRSNIKRIISGDEKIISSENNKI